MTSPPSKRLPAKAIRCTHVSEEGARCPRTKHDDLPVCKEHYDGLLDARSTDSPITGRRMKALGRLKGDYKDAVDDPDIYSHLPVIALHDVRLIELIERINTGDTAKFREQLLAMFKDYDALLAEGDDTKAGKVYGEIAKLLEDGVSRDKAWDAALALGARRNALAAQASEILLKSAQVVSQRDLSRLVKTLITIILEEAPRDVAFTIVSKFDREGMARIDQGGSGTSRSELEHAVRELPGAPEGVLSGRIGSGPLGDAGSDR